METTNKPLRHSSILKNLGILPVLVIFIIIFSFMSPQFGTLKNMINILRTVSINLVIATGMTLVILSGGIDLSVGSIVALSGVVAMKVSISSFPDFALPAALLLGLLAGLINGGLVAKAGIPPFIATLGSMTFLRGIALLICNGNSINNDAISFAWIGNDSLGAVPWLVIIAFSLSIIASFVLKMTTLGTRIYAVGGNSQAAKYTGINVSLILIIVYALSGFFSSVGGIIISSRLYSANGLIGQGYEMDAITATILGGTSFTGGKGNLFGTFLGVLIIGVLNTGLTIAGVSYYLQLVIKGLVVIIAVFVDILRNQLSNR